jgi:hypothetical protein
MSKDDNFYEEDVVSEEEKDDIVQFEEVEEKVIQSDKASDFIYDQVKGGHGKKHILADLNKKKLGHHEMDELFCDWF